MMVNMSITIPSRLADKIAEDRAVRGMVEINITPFQNWYLHSKMPFFPEYTDHGPKHVSGLLLAEEAGSHLKY